LVKIDRETGTVTWDSYSLYPRLFHDAFEEKYPHLTPIHDEYTVHGFRERIYRFPATNLDGYQVETQITFYDAMPSGIHIMRVNPPDSEDEIWRWRKQLPRWVQVAQRWLIIHLGPPHEVQPGVLYDEKNWLTPEEIQLLQLWCYGFEWGEAGFWYDSLEEPGDIYIRHRHIRNWEELAAECEIRLQKQQKQHGQYTFHLLATRSLIDVLSAHFDFQTTKPRVSSTGLQFRQSDLLHTNERVVWVTVHPNSVEKRYEIQATDTLEKVFVPADDYLQLAEKLGAFLAKRSN
jgi:hypothetical protein